jgi:hypothetical protein
MGLPMRRHMLNGQPAGFQIQFQDEWMDMDAFYDPTFQASFFEPWRRKNFPGIARFNRRSRGIDRGRRGAGPMRSSNSRGMSFDPAMLDAIMGGG